MATCAPRLGRLPRLGLVAVELLDAARLQRAGQRGRQVVRQRRERALAARHHERAGDARGIALRQPLRQRAAVAGLAQHEVVGGGRSGLARRSWQCSRKCPGLGRDGVSRSEIGRAGRAASRGDRARLAPPPATRSEGPDEPCHCRSQGLCARIEFRAVEAVLSRARLRDPLVGRWPGVCPARRGQFSVAGLRPSRRLSRTSRCTCWCRTWTTGTRRCLPAG